MKFSQVIASQSTAFCINMVAQILKMACMFCKSLKKTIKNTLKLLRQKYNIFSAAFLAKNILFKEIYISIQCSYILAALGFVN